MVERGGQSRVGTRSIGVETSGGFCYGDDSDINVDLLSFDGSGIDL